MKKLIDRLSDASENLSYAITKIGVICVDSTKALSRLDINSNPKDYVDLARFTGDVEMVYTALISLQEMLILMDKKNENGVYGGQEIKFG